MRAQCAEGRLHDLQTLSSLSGLTEWSGLLRHKGLHMLRVCAQCAGSRIHDLWTFSCSHEPTERAPQTQRPAQNVCCSTNFKSNLQHSMHGADFITCRRALV
eukprot:1159737-Pelagomonas_calceolata.AAC.2